MTGFETLDRAMVQDALEEFLPDLANVTRRNMSQVKGDYVKGAPTSVATGVKCRIIPLTETGEAKIKAREWPGAIVEDAQYLITLQNLVGVTFAQGDTVTVGTKSYTLLAVRYDFGSWNECIRALGVDVE